MSQQETVQRFVDACAGDPDITAAFLGGSHAAGMADPFSDLDLYVITTDEGYDRFFDRRRELLQRLGHPVFAEDFSGFGFDMLLFILSDGVDGELAFARASRFTHIHGGPFQVLVDKQGILRGVEFPLFRPDASAQRQALRELLVSFWRDAWQFSKAMARAQVWSAQGGLERMRRAVMNLMRLQADFSAAAEGYSKVDHVLGAKVLATLEDTVCPLETDAMWRAARKLGGLCRDIGTDLARRQSVDYPSALDGVVSDRWPGSPHTVRDD